MAYGGSFLYSQSLSGEQMSSAINQYGYNLQNHLLCGQWRCLMLFRAFN